MDYRDDRIRTGGRCTGAAPRCTVLDNPKDPGGFAHGLGVLARDVIQNKVEAACARSDLFERRQRLMNDWAACLDRYADARARR